MREVWTLTNFPTSKVCQFPKKMESSKATARHIKQVVGDSQATQINLMCHQCTELSSGMYKKRKPPVKPKQVQEKLWNRCKQVISRRVLTLSWCTRMKIDVTKVEILLILKGSSAQQRSFNVRHAISLVMSLYKPLFPEDSTKTSSVQAQETQSAPVEDLMCLSEQQE